MARDGARRSGRHRSLPHTADVGFEATASDLEALFEEAARALVELSVDVSPGTVPRQWEAVDLGAPDLAGLAYEWLNELISLGDLGRGAVIDARVDHISQSTPDASGLAWHIGARVGLHPHGHGEVEAVRQLKSATYHGLSIEPRGARWTLRAYLDV